MTRLWTWMCLLGSLSINSVAVQLEGVVQLPGGPFQMGIDDISGINGESPSYQTQVKPFKIDRYLVSNRDFLKFIEEKPNFKTDAENRGWSNVFISYIKRANLIMEARHHEPEKKESWMIPIIGASWKMPQGPESNLEGILDHPVVHLSKRDAAAYCSWRRKRLPTEFEWEFAARGGLKGSEYPWGDLYEMGRTNLWQGAFPGNDSARDGYAGTSPVQAFRAQNRYGLHDMLGNVWEWTSTPWHVHFKTVKGREHDLAVRGGSHLDSRKGNVGERARISTRLPRKLTYGASNLGFRCASGVPIKVEKPSKWFPKFSRIRSEL